MKKRMAFLQNFKRLLHPPLPTFFLPNQQILLVQKFVENQAKSERWYDTADNLLEFTIEGDRLRDIITKVEVTDLTI